MAYETEYKSMENSFSMGKDAKPTTQLDDVYESLRKAIDLSNMVVSAANILLGSVPPAKESSKLEVVSDGVIGDLVSRSREASLSLSGAIESVHRINRAFGL